MIDKELMDQFQILATGMIHMEEHLKDHVDERARHTEILIENTITKRIDSLVDGYEIVHEKQWELERRVENLEKNIAELQGRIA